MSFTSFNYPPTVFRIDLGQPSASPTRWASPDVAVDPASVEVERVSYASKDGTQITMFVVHKAGFVPAGDAPAMIVAHGALGTSMAPAFTASFFPWFDAGGVLAVPHLRGGGEYGDAWHRAAMREKKQTAVDDLLAAADWLIANRYTRADRLALTRRRARRTDGRDRDGSAARSLSRGGADVAARGHAALPPIRVRGRTGCPSTDRPMIRRRPPGFAPTRRISGSTAGTKYPAVLITVQESGGPVHAMHARKLAAALQAASGSDRAERPVLIRVDRAGASDRTTPRPCTSPISSINARFSPGSWG